MCDSTNIGLFYTNNIGKLHFLSHILFSSTLELLFLLHWVLKFCFGISLNDLCNNVNLSINVGYAISGAARISCYTIMLHCSVHCSVNNTYTIELNGDQYIKELKFTKNMLQRSIRLSRSGIVGSFFI